MFPFGFFIEKAARIYDKISNIEINIFQSE